MRGERVERVDSSGKNTNAHSAALTAPAAYTGRRPTRSDSAPNSGMSASWNAEPMSTALRPTPRGSPRFVVMNVRM